MSDNDLAERWKPAPPRHWLSPATADEARALAREGVLAALVYALIGLWTIVGSLGAGPLALLAPSVILGLSLVAGVALWWKQGTWAALLLGAIALYFCFTAALPLLHGAFNFLLLLYLGLLVLAGRTLIATTKLWRLQRQALLDAPAIFD
jgi:hypothetical protein